MSAEAAGRTQSQDESCGTACLPRQPPPQPVLPRESISISRLSQALVNQAPCVTVFTGDSEKDVELWGKAAQRPREQAREDTEWSLPKPRGRTWAFDMFSPPSAVGWCPGRGRWQWGPHQPLISEGLAGWTPGPGPVPPGMDEGLGTPRNTVWGHRSPSAVGHGKAGVPQDSDPGAW